MIKGSFIFSGIIVVKADADGVPWLYEGVHGIVTNFQK
jgi:hypothetical protein